MIVCILITIFIIFCVYIIFVIGALRTQIEEINEDLVFYEDLRKAYQKLDCIEQCIQENSNGSIQNLVNRIETILRRDD